MKTPPFLIGAALVLWGWQTDLLIPALLMIPVIEGARFIRTRWVLSLSDFYRISDISTLFLLGIAIYVLFTHPRAIIMLTIQWLPLITLPLIAAQEYSTEGKIDIRAFLMLTRKNTMDKDQPAEAVNFSYPYFILCLIAAASSSQRSAMFYLCLLLLAGWALFPHRSRRYPFAVWCVLIFMAGVSGYMLHIGLNHMQELLISWASDLFLEDSNPEKSTTAIGDIGEVKQSSRIVYRVDGNEDLSPGLLMREASYNQYFSSTWFAGGSEFTEIQPERNQKRWSLGARQMNADTLTVSSYLQQGRGILKLPAGAFEMESIAGLRLKKNSLGAVMAEEGAGLIHYTVWYSREFVNDRPPDHQDLQVPPDELPGISRFINMLGLSGRSPDEVLPVLKLYFQKNFTYSLDLAPQHKEHTPISNFLLFTRSGHCEYFATATVLLLRACGIPARYAKGFLAHEYSRMENRIVVRSRHAHAWAQVYVNGKWRNFDTTPSAWLDAEEEAMSILNLIPDMLSFLLCRFSEWRWSIASASWKNFTPVLLIPLAIILIRRIYSKKKIERVQRTIDRKTGTNNRTEAESGFYQIEKQLNELGFKRYPWETMYGWITRMENTLPGTISPALFLQPLHLHYRTRFGEHGLNPKEKKELAAQVDEMMKNLQFSKSQISLDV
jgi:protein-glutamine gamma-glutamyltransferase